MNNYQISIPNALKHSLSKYNLVEIIKGRLSDEIIKFEGKNNQVVYLKSGTGVSSRSLKQEATVLKWFENKNINVPRVVDYYEDRYKTYLLISAIKGVSSHKLKDQLEIKDILKIVANALKDFHNLSIIKSKSLNSIDKNIKKIHNFISLDVIDTEAFCTSNKGKTPIEIFNYLCSNQHLLDNNALTHGDYCLPNIIIDKGNYGFIDLGDCGVGDKHKDFSSMEVSIKRNFGVEWIDVFYQLYDKKLLINRDKILYYQLIDQFDYHLDIDKYSRLSR